MDELNVSCNDNSFKLIHKKCHPKCYHNDIKYHMTLIKKFGAPFLNTNATKNLLPDGWACLNGNTMTLKCIEVSILKKKLKLHVSCTWKSHFDLDIIKFNINLIIFDEKCIPNHECFEFAYVHHTHHHAMHT